MIASRSQSYSLEAQSSSEALESYPNIIKRPQGQQFNLVYQLGLIVIRGTVKFALYVKAYSV